MNSPTTPPPTARCMYDDSGRAETMIFIGWVTDPYHNQWGWHGKAAFAVYRAPAADCPKDGGNYPAGHWVDAPYIETIVRTHVK